MLRIILAGTEAHCEAKEFGGLSAAQSEEKGKNNKTAVLFCFFFILNSDQLRDASRLLSGNGG